MIRGFRTAIVTGASRGVGVYIAKALAAEGMNLVLAARNSAALDMVAKEITAPGVRVVADDGPCDWCALLSVTTSLLGQSTTAQLESRVPRKWPARFGAGERP